MDRGSEEAKGGRVWKKSAGPRPPFQRLGSGRKTHKPMLGPVLRSALHGPCSRAYVVHGTTLWLSNSLSLVLYVVRTLNRLQGISVTAPRTIIRERDA